MDNSTSQSKWYDKGWLVGLLLIIFFPVGLYGLWKNAAISKGLKIGVTVVFAIIVIWQLGSDNKTSSSSREDLTSVASADESEVNEKEMNTASSQSLLEFNTQDKDAINSGNVAVARNNISNLKLEDVLNNIYSNSISKITKSPYSHIGKFVKLFGNISKIEELPPSDGQTGKWAEILLLVENPNSPLGFTTVDFLYNGDAEKIDANKDFTIAGYFIGNYSSANAMGGQVEGIVIVGNYVAPGMK